MFFRRSTPPTPPSKNPEDIRGFLLDIQANLLKARQCFAGQSSDAEPNPQLDLALHEVNQAVQHLSRPIS